MGCCDGDLEETDKGVVVHRKCRDVLPLLAFIGWWAGMFVVCALAFKSGDPNRLVYGVDSYGNTCGSKTTFQGSTFDLSQRKSLYYLNPLDLLSLDGIAFAKSVCVDTCPGASTCGIASFPCLDTAAFRCPYYAFAQSGISGLLPGVDVADVSYLDKLCQLKSVNDSAAGAFINYVNGLELSGVSSWMASNNLSSSGSISGLYYQLTSQFPDKGPCSPVYIPTQDYLFRCIPKFTENFTQGVVDSVGELVPSSAAQYYKDSFSSVSASFSRYTGDIAKAAIVIIFSGLICGMIMCLVWMLLMRFLAGAMVWLTILMVNLVLTGFTVYCFAMAGFLGSKGWAESIQESVGTFADPTASERTMWKWIAVSAAVVAGCVLVFTLLMISRVRVAIACIKVASQAVGAMPSILLWPLVPFVLEVGLVIYWVAVTALLYTAGDLTATCRAPADRQSFGLTALGNVSVSSLGSTAGGTVSCYSNYTGDTLSSLCAADANCYLSYKWNSQIRYAFIYHFFGLLWTNQVIVGISCVTVAGAVGSFYWAGGDKSQLPAMPVLTAAKNTFVFHLGSIAFGAFIIAVIQFIRFLLDYLDRKTRDLQASNKCAEWLMCCIKCCAWCLEKLVAFINRNAYIMVGVKGTSYCVSAFTAIKLILTNALRLVAVNFVGDMVLFFGKVTVAASCGLVAFALCDLNYFTDATNHPTTYLSSPVFPVALSIIIGFVVAEIFFSVHEMAIDTVLLAFCDDCETHGGTPRFAPPLLMEAMGQDAHQPAVVKSGAVAPVTD